MALFLTLLKSSWPLVLAALGGGWVACSLQGFRLDDLKHDFAGYKSQVEQQAVEARQAALKQKEAWIKRVDRVLGDGHCRTSYEHSMAHLFDALEYRP